MLFASPKLKILVASVRCGVRGGELAFGKNLLLELLLEYIMSSKTEVHVQGNGRW